MYISQPQPVFVRFAKLSIGLVFMLLVNCFPATAQLPGAQPDPLARIRDAAKGNVEACSATGETLCEQVAPKIVANAQGESPLAANLLHLMKSWNDNAGGANPRLRDVTKTVAWAVAAFRDAGVEVHIERYAMSEAGAEGGSRQQEIVVAEIRGREKPDEWVVLGAHLDMDGGNSGPGNSSLDDDCDAALVIEAARDIQLTGVRPRRSIRFVLFTGQEHDMLSSWAYLRAHRSELVRAHGAILVAAGANRLTNYTLNGRHDVESGVREALKPIDSVGDSSYHVDYRFTAPLEPDSFDFVLEGIPTIVAGAADAIGGDSHRRAAANPAPDQLQQFHVDVGELKRSTAIVAVTAFGVAERAEPLGPRQSRVEVASLLRASGLERQMKADGLWPLWESGQRGRFP